MRGQTSVLVALILFSFGNIFALGLKDKMGIGLQVNSQKLYGDSYTGTFEYGVTPIYLRLNWKPSVFIDAEAGYAKARVANPTGLLETDFFSGGLKMGYRMFNQFKITPLLYAGVGAFSFESSSAGRVYDGYGAIGGGVEFFVTRFLGVNLTADYRLTSNDGLDGADLASSTDSFLNVSFGFNYYTGRGHTFYADDMDFNMVDEYSAFEEVETMSISPADELTAQEYTNYTFKKEQLMRSIEQSENEIKLLRAKVDVLKEQSDEIEERIKMADLMGDKNRSHTDKDRYLVHYRNAIILFQAKYYDNAIITLETLIEEQPFHPLTASAWYWIGESRFNQEKFEDATAAFRRSALMSKSNLKTELSQLMIGLCHMKSGDDTAARINFEKLIQVSSNASCTELAREYLNDLTTLN